jgi:hypothetical protein
MRNKNLIQRMIVRGLLFLASMAASLSLASCDTIFGLLNNRSDSRANTPTSNTPGSSSLPVDIVYNDSDSADTAVASGLSALLKTNLTAVSGVTGTSPTFTTTLVAQSSIPNSFTASYQLTGKVIIMTPGTTIAVYQGTSQAGQEHNLANQKGAIVVMGGENLLETPPVSPVALMDDINKANPTWLPSGDTTPTGLGIASGVGYTGVTSVDRPSGVAVWSSPLSYTGISASGPITLYSVGCNEQTDTAVVSGVQTYAQSIHGNYSIVRQGRFMQYGFSGVPDLTTGQVLFQNLIVMMGTYALP